MLGALAWTALAMGLVGGSHCLVMCAAPCSAVVRVGARVAPALTATEQVVDWHPSGGVALRRLLAYHLGRLAGYSSAGAAVAVAMQSFSWVTQQAHAMRSAWTFMHVAVLAWGLMMLLLARQPTWVESAGRALWARVRPLIGAPGGVFVTGFLWALMPCGLLYSALLVAALSGGPVQGAITMALFAAGSGVWLIVGPWAWLGLRQRLNRARADWGTRLGGLLLCGVAGWALWHDLVVRPSLICQ
ncbi:MAG: sulfite exporter TauE/SafE family protein [Simplicispira suum]|uniref:sulfite exporter TauE/SafE family protein n=1 Tax=Simplicispira suum TaxID=2109915 RepID=UPI001C6AB9CB|nr:sulfite exporter TauE/SafE family protein [Simplicispira suum]MBW7834455.1 sulfite exporter TauE/SafE family protein [Simplicispira suum]